MNNRFAAVLMVAAIFTVRASSAAEPASRDATSDIAAFEDRLARAIDERDRAALETLIADPFTWVHASDGRLDTREVWLANAAKGMAASLADVRAMGPVGGAVGFSLLKGDELNQLYVSSAARGSGVAVSLLVDAEQLLAARGVETAWLACAIGNHRAARFYEKNAWRRVCTVSIQVPAATGTLPLDVWRYEKKP